VVTASTRGVKVVGADVDGDRDAKSTSRFSLFDVAPTSSGSKNLSPTESTSAVSSAATSAQNTAPR
jgi:hypothetical protein